MHIFCCESDIQKFRNYLIDDGSTDGAGDICDCWAEKDRRILVFHKRGNGSPSSARNYGLDKASDSFISFIDSDDYIEASTYEEVLEIMKDQNVDLVNYGRIVHEKENVSISKNKNSKITNVEALLHFFTGDGQVTPMVWDKIYQKKVFDENLRFKEKVTIEDKEIMPRILERCDKVFVMDKALYHYVRREGSITRTKNFNPTMYRYLESLKDYEKMCKSKYIELLSYFYYYEMKCYYGMLKELARCMDHKRYVKYEIVLRYNAIKAVLKCIIRTEIRKQYKNQIKEILVNSILGIELTNKILNKRNKAIDSV